MLRNSTKKLAVLAGIAIVSLLATGCSSDAEADGDGPIKIGYLASLSGLHATTGEKDLIGVSAIVDDINEHGGILGRDVELVQYDDKSDPTETARGAQELAERGVVAIIGPSGGSQTLAAAPITNGLEIPIIAMVGTAGLTDPSQDFFPYTFRSAVADDLALPAIWERAKRDGHEKIAVFGIEDAYGRYGITTFEALANDDDSLELVATPTATADASDYAAQALLIQQAGADAVILQTGTPQVISGFLRAAANVGLEVPMYGGLGASRQELIDALPGGSAENLITLNMGTPTEPTELQQELLDILEAQGKDTSRFGFEVVQGASAMRIFQAAIEKAGEASGPAIKEALDSGLVVPAYTLAPYSFSKDDHAGLSADAVIWTNIRDGKFYPVD